MCCRLNVRYTISTTFDITLSHTHTIFHHLPTRRTHQTTCIKFRQWHQLPALSAVRCSVHRPMSPSTQPRVKSTTQPSKRQHRYADVNDGKVSPTAAAVPLPTTAPTIPHHACPPSPSQCRHCDDCSARRWLCCSSPRLARAAAATPFYLWPALRHKDCTSTMSCTSAAYFRLAARVVGKEARRACPPPRWRWRMSTTTRTCCADSS